MRNIYLIGMMGSGKTTTGKALAILTSKKFFDLDSEIETRNRLTINEIFSKKGEPFFRAEEKKILSEASELSDTVVATGGGVVLDKDNVARMKATGEIVYLEATLDTLWERVQHKKDRPLLYTADPMASLSGIYEKRKPLYKEASGGKVVTTDSLSPEVVAKKIFEFYFKR